MATKYTTVTVSGYNASPPADDGTVSETNKITWAKGKTKLSDPLKTAIEAIDTKLIAAADTSPSAKTTNYTTTTTDHDTAILATSGVTISLGDAASMGSGYYVTIKNAAASGAVTVSRITSGNNINGVAGDVVLGSQQAETFVCDGSHYSTLVGQTVIGEVRMYGGASSPGGWLLCDGSAVSRTTYARLFTEISTTFGVGDGLTTFNIPNFKGRSPVGVGQGSTAEGGGTGTSRTLGATGGAETHTMTEAEMPSHSHTIDVNGTGSATPNAVGTGSAPAGVSTNITGSDDPHNNMHPWLAINFIIKY